MLPGGDEERRGSTQVLCGSELFRRPTETLPLVIRERQLLNPGGSTLPGVHAVLDQVWQEDQAYKGTQRKGRKRQSEGQRQQLAAQQEMGQPM